MGTLSDVLKTCLGIEEGEEVLILCDEKSFKQGLVLEKAARGLSREVILAKFKAREISGNEPPFAVAEMIKAASVIIAPTSFSLTHTQATREASKKGARVASMPGITLKMLKSGALFADYEKINRLAKYYAEELTKGKEIVIKSDNAVLTASIEGREGYADGGILREKGRVGNLPAGEAFIAPVEESTNGKIVFDASFGRMGRLNEKIWVEIESGIAKETNSKELEEVFNAYENSRFLCEIGIGLNERARITGNVLEDEKVLGTVHCAFGNNLKFGGKINAKVHIDGVIKKPTLLIDGKEVIKEGKLLHAPAGL